MCTPDGHAPTCTLTAASMHPCAPMHRVQKGLGLMCILCLMRSLCCTRAGARSVQEAEGVKQAEGRCRARRDCLQAQRRTTTCLQTGHWTMLPFRRLHKVSRPPQKSIPGPCVRSAALQPIIPRRMCAPLSLTPRWRRAPTHAWHPPAAARCCGIERKLLALLRRDGRGCAGAAPAAC